MAKLAVQGLDQLLMSMAGVSQKLAKSALRTGLRKGANVVRGQARANFNGAGGPNDITRALKSSIRVASRRGTPTRITYSVVAGDLTKAQAKKFGTDAAYYALWVEKGHINRKFGQALRGSKERVKAARAASTNNTPAHPYMQPAIRQKAQEAIDTVAREVRERLPEAAR